MNTDAKQDYTFRPANCLTTRAEWLAQRRALLRKEKELTRQRDALNAERRRLPMLAVEKPYRFEGALGATSLIDLFEGRRQLIIYHFMWLWENGQPKETPCRSCSSWADEIARGHLTHLHARGTSLALVSRAPYEVIAPFQKRMGWQVPWYSSFNSDFNYDFQVTLDETIRPLEYNYRSRAEAEALGKDDHFSDDQPFDLPGISCFIQDQGSVFYTYSTYAKGGESVGGSGYFLDLTVLGRQEEWEEPKGRLTGLGIKAGHEMLYPDEYPAELGMMAGNA